MAAQKTDIAAEKARKQKIVLAVAGVLLVGLAVIQVPKLMKGDSAPAAAPVAETAPAAAATPTATPTTAAAVTTTTVAVTGKPAAFVAGVGLPATHVPAPAKSQLASFTLFAGGDPFVQQVSDATGADGATAAPSQPAADSAPPEPTASQGDGGTASSGSGSSAQAQPPIDYATIMFEGKPQQLQVKDTFPKGDPMFVLVSLKKKQAKIGVAGGAFDDGQTVTLALGKKVTLLNTATGVRYVLKLVYTGSQPEVIEGFTTKADQPPAAPADGGASASSTVSAIPTATTP